MILRQVCRLYIYIHDRIQFEFRSLKLVIVLLQQATWLLELPEWQAGLLTRKCSEDNDGHLMTFCEQIDELEADKLELEKQVNELKAKCEQIEKRAQEQRQVEEKKHAEEIQFLKKTNQQLKVNHIHHRVDLSQ